MLTATETNRNRRKRYSKKIAKLRGWPSAAKTPKNKKRKDRKRNNDNRTSKATRSSQDRGGAGSSEERSADSEGGGGRGKSFFIRHEDGGISAGTYPDFGGTITGLETGSPDREGSVGSGVDSERQPDGELSPPGWRDDGTVFRPE